MTFSPPAPADRPAPPPAYRWSVWLFVSLAMMGNYYVYDAVGPNADLLKSQLGFSDSQIGTLNGIYSLPNLFMVLLGGIIIDRIGARRATIIFSVLTFLGAVVTALSGDFLVMAAGRLIFGLGAESMIVAITTALAQWFKGKELAFAFGLNLTVARFGSFAADRSPSWFSFAFETWRGPLVVAAVIGTTCVLGAVLYAVLDGAASRRYALGAAGSTDKVVFKDLFSFGRTYWFVVALCFSFYSVVFPFRTFANKYFQETRGMTRADAGDLLSFLPLAAMIATPLFGLLADYIGRRASLMVLGTLILLPVFPLMGGGNVPLIVPLAMLGVAFSMIPALMWPSVTYLVDGPRLGTAYGLMTLIQNIGLMGLNFLVGRANDAAGASAQNPAGYGPMIAIFGGLSAVAFVFAILLWFAERGPKAHGLETIVARQRAS